MVQANSWTFFPASKHSDKLCNAEVGSAGCDAVSRLKRRECYENARLEELSGNERAFSEYSDCGGCLEIHSLKLLDETSAPTAQVSLLLHSEFSVSSSTCIVFVNNLEKMFTFCFLLRRC
jgi:hypothetical protein